MKTSWKDITIADFQRIYELEKAGDEERLLQLIAIVNGISYDDVLEMPISKLREHYADIDFLGEEPKIPLMKPSYYLNGTKYHVYGKEMTTAQYIDFKQMLPTYYENLPRFMTVFLVPAGHKYNDGYDLEKAVQDISTMSIVDARAVCSFFSIAYGVSMSIFLRSSVRRLRRMERKAKNQEEKEALHNLLEKMREWKRQHTIGSTS